MSSATVQETQKSGKTITKLNSGNSNKQQHSAQSLASLSSLLSTAAPVTPVVQQPKIAAPAAPLTNNVINDAGLIPQGVANQMQADAVALAPAAPLVVTATDSESAEIVSVVSNSSNAVAAQSGVLEAAGLNNFNKLSCGLMITVNLCNPRFFEGQAKPLAKSKDITGETVNLYSPFRKAKAEKGIAAGVFRPLIARAMKILATINDANIVIAGSQSDVAGVLNKSVCAARAEIDNLFPKFDSPETSVEGISLRDVFHSTSWVNCKQFAPEEGGVALAVHSGFINFIVNSGSMYDDVDRIKLLRQLETNMNLVHTKYPQVPIMLVVSFASEDIEYGETRDLITMMLDEDGYDVASRSKLVRMIADPTEAFTWAPQSISAIDKDFLPQGADLAFVKTIGETEEADEDVVTGDDEAE